MFWHFWLIVCEAGCLADVVEHHGYGYDLLDDVIDDGVDVAFALKVLLWWNGLCDDDEACFDIIVGDVIGTFGVSK